MDITKDIQPMTAFRNQRDDIAADASIPAQACFAGLEATISSLDMNRAKFTRSDLT